MVLVRYEGGFFKARLDFPPDFPNQPPTMTFKSEMWHPNVYEDGKVNQRNAMPADEDGKVARKMRTNIVSRGASAYLGR